MFTRTSFDSPSSALSPIPSPQMSPVQTPAVGPTAEGMLSKLGRSGSEPLQQQSEQTPASSPTETSLKDIPSQDITRSESITSPQGRLIEEQAEVTVPEPDETFSLTSAAVGSNAGLSEEKITPPDYLSIVVQSSERLPTDGYLLTEPPPVPRRRLPHLFISPPSPQNETLGELDNLDSSAPFIQKQESLEVIVPGESTPTEVVPLELQDSQFCKINEQSTPPQDETTPSLEKPTTIPREDSVLSQKDSVLEVTASEEAASVVEVKDRAVVISEPVYEDMSPTEESSTPEVMSSEATVPPEITNEKDAAFEPSPEPSPETESLSTKEDISVPEVAPPEATAPKEQEKGIFSMFGGSSASPQQSGSSILGGILPGSSTPKETSGTGLFSMFGGPSTQPPA